MSDRLPVVTGKDLVHALQKVGWSVSHIRGSHHQLHHMESGRRITVPVHAGKDLKRGLLQGILVEVGISNTELRTLL